MDRSEWSGVSQFIRVGSKVINLTHIVDVELEATERPYRAGEFGPPERCVRLEYDQAEEGQVVARLFFGEEADAIRSFFLDHVLCVHPLAKTD
jgi:hypothetical protein